MSLESQNDAPDKQDHGLPMVEEPYPWHNLVCAIIQPSFVYLIC